MEDKCRFLCNFSQHTAEVEIPGDALMPKSTQYYVRIARFLPEVKVVEKHNVAARRILIRGHNGKIYPYLVLNDTCLSDSRREERVLQLLRLLNQYLVNRKETGRRYLQFTAQRVVAINPGLRLVEDNTSSLSLTDILKRRINRGKHAGGDLDNDSPIREYYDRLIKIQSLGGTSSPKNIRDIFTDIQNKMVPKNMLKEWSIDTYVNATDYWVFRSQLTYQLAMACLCEYAFLLTSLTPDSMYIHQDTGCISVAFYKFDQSETIESNAVRRQVPFRLTPNLSELITPTGIDGPFRGALDAVANCLTTPNTRVASIFKAILRDEMLFWYKKGYENFENHKLIEMVNRMVKKIQQRLNEIGGTEERPTDSQIPILIGRATNVDNLSQTDPAWHPWL
jgi:transformation/transcription domain-associated protein